MPRAIIWTGSLVLLAAVWPRAAGAQVVQGRVVDTSGQPVAVALVTLVDEQGTDVRSVVTTPEGTFVINAGAPGIYQIRVDRIGLASHTTPAFQLDAGEQEWIEITVPTSPVVLEGVEADIGGRCDVRPRDRQVIARLWEDARRAVSDVPPVDPARDLAGLVAVHYLREVSPDGRVQTAVNGRREFDASSRVPFGAIADLILMRDGFMLSRANGDLAFYGPAPGFPLLEEFLDIHCFDAIEEGAGTIGLRFRPVDEVGRVTIGGTLWLEVESLEPAALDFEYYDPVSGRPNGGSGHIEYVRMPSGARMISRWWIRTPSHIELPPENVERGSVRTLALSEEGGIVLGPDRKPIGNDDGVLFDVTRATIEGELAETFARTTLYAIGASTSMFMRATPRERYSVAAPVIRASLSTLTLEEIERDFGTVAKLSTMLQERFPSLMVDEEGNVFLRAYYPACSPPLFVVNGTPTDAATALALNPRDVARVDVLRRGAETAIYGFRGSCGVIEIRTR